MFGPFVGIGLRAYNRAQALIDYLFKDEFTTDDAAPIIGKYEVAIPGPGEISTVDSVGTNITLGNGSVTFNDFVADGDPGVWSANAFTRTAGLGLFVKYEHREGFYVGWDVDQANGPNELPQFRPVDAETRAYDGAFVVFGGATLGSDYTVLHMLRSQGALIFVKGGTEFPDWTLVWTSKTGSTASLYPTFSLDANRAGSQVIDTMRVAQLPAPFNSDYGYADGYSASPSVWDTLTAGSGDFILEYTVSTMPTAATQRIQFREQDGSNYWRVQISSTGGIALYEIVDSNTTTRGSTTGVTAGAIIKVFAVDETIKVYIDGLLGIEYTSATNFKTETLITNRVVGGDDGAISDLAVWPYYATSATIAVFDSYMASDSSETFLLRDDFEDRVRTAEPGPGTWDVTDPSNIFNISNGKLTWGSAGTTGDPMLATSSPVFVTRVSGMLFSFTLNALDELTMVGLDATSTDASPEDDAVGFLPASQLLQARDDAGSVVVDADIAPSTDYQFAIVTRSSGAFYFIKGGAYTEWTLYWPSLGSVGGSKYFIMSAYTSTTGSFGNFNQAQLPEPFDTDNGIATDSIASPTVTDTFVHEADFIMEFIVDTLPSAGEISCKFRVQDSNNYWQVSVKSDATIVLREWVSGAASTRANTTPVLSGGERIVVIADDDDITTYYDSTQAFTYASASNFKTETSGEVSALGTGGAISNLIVWPRTLSGTAKDALDMYTE